MKGSRDLLLEFLDPLYISGMVEGRNFKFGVQIDYEGLPLVQWPTRLLSYGPRRPPMKINKKFALQLPKLDFYSFKL